VGEPSQWKWIALTLLGLALAIKEAVEFFKLFN
jgi:hypothetical protein